MSSTQITLKCGKCGVPLQAPTKPKPDDLVTCPSCGDSATYKAVMDQARKQATEFVADTIDAAFRKATRGSKFLKYTPKRKP